MKRIIVATLILLAACQPTEENNTEQTADTANTKTEEQTIQEGEFELKQYYFVMLTRGTKRGEITDTAKINQLQMGHLANIDRLYNEGKILVAGPFGDDGNWRGILIFNCPTQEEVEQHLHTDPMIQAGWLGYEVHPWWTAKNEVFK